MTDTIIGSLIGAASSIAVALITVNAQRATKKADDIPDKMAPANNRNSTLIMNDHKKTWVIVIFISLGWIILSPILINHDLAGTNMFVMGGVIILLAYLKPVNPLTPVTLSVALILLAVFMEPIAKYITLHQSIAFSGEGGIKWTPVVVIIIAAALISGLVDYLRLQKFK